MMDAILGLFGPLAKPECLRSSKRGYWIWLRLLPALGAGLVVLSVLWAWSVFQRFDPTHLPYYEFRIGLTIIAGSLLSLAFLIPPATLAGSLAGEKERGSIGLLLSTQASSADIVLGRWVGRLAPVALVAASALPGLFLLALLAGMNPAIIAMLVILPSSVALGGGGFALGISAISKRGRDALLVVYLIEVVLMLGSIFASGSVGGSGWFSEVSLDLFNPFATLGPLIWDEQIAPSVLTGSAWLVLGGLGLAVASWRLRPSCLRDDSGSRRDSRRVRRAWSHRVPPVGERPMLWKELHIERAGSMGRVGRWIGGLLVVWLALGSLILGGMVLRAGSIDAEPWAVGTLAAWYGGPAILISFLIQWSIGLRAGVAIASERERGTWDGLLTSPLTGAEIIRGKLWGSLHALRWLIVAAFMAWTISWACEAMTNRQYVSALADTLCWSGLMAATGVAMSLRTATATKAMGATLAAWLGAYLTLAVIAFVVCLLVVGMCVLGWLSWMQMGLISSSSAVWFPMTFGVGMKWATCGLTLILTALIVLDTRVRFDRIAGRMTGGATAAKLDELIHGRPMAPVRLDPAPG